MTIKEKEIYVILNGWQKLTPTSILYCKIVEDHFRTLNLDEAFEYESTNISMQDLIEKFIIKIYNRPTTSL
jgi:hypothetical protein